MAAVKNGVKHRAVCHSAAEDESWPLGGNSDPVFLVALLCFALGHDPSHQRDVW